MNVRFESKRLSYVARHDKIIRIVEAEVPWFGGRGSVEEGSYRYIKYGNCLTLAEYHYIIVQKSESRYCEVPGLQQYQGTLAIVLDYNPAINSSECAQPHKTHNPTEDCIQEIFSFEFGKEE